jgi:hypothetical protein
MRGAGEPLLHRLEQALEVPDGKHVALHEPPEPGGGVHEAVDPMADEPLTAVGEVDRAAGSGAGGKRGDRVHTKNRRPDRATNVTLAPERRPGSVAHGQAAGRDRFSAT